MEIGIFEVNMVNDDVMTASYYSLEKFFLYLPCWYKLNKDEWVVSGKFSSFYKGFCKDDSLIKDKPAIIRNKPSHYNNVVLIGFDPAFRIYNASSFRLLFNTMIYFDSLTY